MTRPVLDSETTELVNARFVPCQDECARLGLDYAPLSASFGASAVALFGSNMGGKTVVLKTLLFFQLLAQAGLFVPAERFSTRVYGRIEYVGELSGERLAGLSGFGLEIWRLIAARAASSPRAEGPRRADPANADEGAAQGGSPQGGSPQGGSLVAFDELARTTGSHEAEALLSAVIEAYARGGSGRAYFATHFRGVARMPGVEYRRMRGLDREAAAAALGGRDANGRLDGDGRPDEGSAGGEGRGPALAERLAGINRHMRYEVVEDDGSGSESDALAIASFLGLDRSVIERARYYLTKDGV
jgi:hypothetical protein